MIEGVSMHKKHVRVVAQSRSGVMEQQQCINRDFNANSVRIHSSGKRVTTVSIGVNTGLNSGLLRVVPSDGCVSCPATAFQHSIESGVTGSTASLMSESITLRSGICFTMRPIFIKMDVS